MMEKRNFKIRLTYFKSNGKFYTNDAVEWVLRTNSGGGCYMPDAVAKVRGLRETGNPLPGLSSHWPQGYVMVDCALGYPCLLLPLPEKIRRKALQGMNEVNRAESSQLPGSHVGVQT